MLNNYKPSSGIEWAEEEKDIKGEEEEKQEAKVETTTTTNKQSPNVFKFVSIEITATWNRTRYE